MKKRICRLLLAFLLVLVSCVSMAAAEQTGAQLSCVTDTAGLLSENEKMLLERMAENILRRKESQKKAKKSGNRSVKKF